MPDRTGGDGDADGVRVGRCRSVDDARDGGCSGGVAARGTAGRGPCVGVDVRATPVGGVGRASERGGGCSRGNGCGVGGRAAGGVVAGRASAGITPEPRAGPAGRGRASASCAARSARNASFARRCTSGDMRA